MKSLRKRLFFSVKFREKALKLSHYLSIERSEAEVKRASIILFSVSLALSVVILAFPYWQRLPKLAKGEILNKDLKAQIDHHFLNKVETERLRKSAFEKERPAFDLDYLNLEKVGESFKSDVVKILKIVQDPTNKSISHKVQALRSEFEFFSDKAKYPHSMLRALAALKSYELFSGMAMSLLERQMDQFAYLQEPMPVGIFSELQTKGALIRTINATSEIADKYWSSSQLLEKNVTFLDFSYQAKGESSQLSEGALLFILTRSQELMSEYPALRYNANFSSLRRKLAAEKITDVYYTVRRGTTLIHAGDIIDDEKMRLIDELRKAHLKRNGLQILGIFILMAVLSVSISYYVYRFAYGRVKDFSAHLILHSLFWFIFAVAFIFYRLGIWKSYDTSFVLFIPYGFFGILTGQFFGARIALATGIYLSVFSFILAGFDQISFLVTLTSIISGLYASTRMQNRTQLLRGGIAIFIANLVLIIGFDLIASESRFLEYKLIAIALSASAGIFLTLGIMPVYEFLFNLATPFRLMELNDFNHPLLKKMAEIAPSTFSHSVMLANLCESAVRAVGGNTLLTRVGCLFHDIGKMNHPDFYAENRHLYPNSRSFKKMTASTSAQMIVRHVSDGIKMGRQNRLPEKVIAFIPEHHGTTAIQYFYHKALEQYKKLSQNKNLKPIHKSDFQYPGPIPRTRETAIVMLADSIEAASRTAISATREGFSKLIDRIIQNKIDEEQLMLAPLTLGDLAVIKQTFLEVLVSTYHERPIYPTMRSTVQLEDSVRTAQKRKNGRKQIVKKQVIEIPELV